MSSGSTTSATTAELIPVDGTAIDLTAKTLASLAAKLHELTAGKRVLAFDRRRLGSGAPADGYELDPGSFEAEAVRSKLLLTGRDSNLVGNPTTPVWFDDFEAGGGWLVRLYGDSRAEFVLGEARGVTFYFVPAAESTTR